MHFERYAVNVDVTLGTGVVVDALERFRANVEGPGVVVTGAGVSRADVGRGVVAAVRTIDSEATVLAVPPVSTYEDLRYIVRQARLDRVGWLIAVGGGRVMDLAKLIAVTNRGGPAISDVSSREEFDAALPSATSVPNLFVPTTVGSGAEVSMLADVLRDNSGAKVPLAAAALRPSQVVIDASVARAPLGVAGPALIDAIVHVVDPWLNWSPELSLQVHSSIHVLSGLIALVPAVASGRPTDQELLDLARLSHLAVLPGLARPAAHVSSIHRIEHCLPPEHFPSHGIGLAWVAVRYLEWAERERPDEIAPFAVGLARAFGRRALPSRLLGDVFEELAPGSTTVQLAPVDHQAVAHRTSTFEQNGLLPGNLTVTHDDVLAILSAQPTLALPRARVPLTTLHSASRHRVFGGVDPSCGLPLVITPVPAVFHALASPSAQGRTSWYGTAEVEVHDRTVLAVGVTPGASALVDLLDLLDGAGLTCPRVYFLGLAGSLDPSIPLGTCVAPERLYEWSPEVDRSAARKAEGDVRWTSVTSLSEECDDLFAYLQWAGVDLIDLEASAFSGWCRAHGQAHATIFAVSDHPVGSLPVWSGEHQTSQVVEECANQLLTTLGRELRRG